MKRWLRQIHRSAETRKAMNSRRQKLLSDLENLEHRMQARIDSGDLDLDGWVYDIRDHACALRAALERSPLE